MLGSILKAPLKAARSLVRRLRGKKGGCSSSNVSYTPASGGLKRPPEAVRSSPTDAPAGDRGHGHEHGHGHDHGHGHGHDHGHDHGHGHDHAPAAPAAPAPSPAAAAPAPKPASRIRVVAEETPNPNARKFSLVGGTAVARGSLSFNSRDEAEAHPLGRALFAVSGVRSVFAVKDFVTVTKEDGADWGAMEQAIITAIQGALG